ncbi:hypothetical protein [Chryseobacterium taichungense]|uniref:hypothetical protein n=1 Tax=Chryseobacterium taichungense TaxID=295069 RepID=UPI0028AA926F|nr:hypothetical protein [Chryseobacterium taichungense]
MGLVWRINGFDFLDFGVHVSESKGVLDKLKPRERNSYTWDEYHGKQMNLSAPKYDSREIVLSCWIQGADIDDLTEKFNTFLAFFDRSSTNRFTIEPFGKKPYAYEVILGNGAEMTKDFREGVVFGTFELSLIEPNPIKKILKTSLDSFRLKYTSPSETEIFPGDGTKLVGRGDVDFLFQYSAPNYQSSGISLVEGSVINNEYFQLYTIPESLSAYQFSVEATLNSPKDMKLYVIGRKPDDTHEVVGVSGIFQGVTGKNVLSLVKELYIDTYTKFFYKVLDTAGSEIPGIVLKYPRVETAEVVGSWQNMIGKEKIIIIAGNIDDVAIIETPAEVIWEKI